MNEQSNNVTSLQQRIKDLEEQVHMLEQGLIHDGLTGLKTRAFLEEDSRVYFESISQTTSEKRKEWFGFSHISFLFFDVDHFKKINDTYGHAAGDIVLKHVAQTVQDGLRTGDVAARWGGEEIVVSLLGASEDDALRAAQRISENIKGLHFPDAPDLKITVSCGISTTRGGEKFGEIIGRADAALYRAKGSRDTIVKYSDLHKE